jgi:hypothetical protein
LAAGLGLVLVLSRDWPKERLVHVVLGDAASHVQDLRLRCGKHGEWDREVVFHYGSSGAHAPRVVDWQPRLASGDYDVEVELSVRGDPALPPRTVTASRSVTLGDGAASVDVSSIVRDSRETAPLPAPPP